ncbi:MAG: J domain-containing protein, partial [Cyanobacteria bacterium J06558_2]
RVASDYSANTDLASLTLLELVSILAELQELEEAEDEDLLLAFLDALDPDWQTNVFEEEENYQSLEDPYTVLNISQDANTDEIKKAYRNLARQVHPDTSGLPDWIFKQINRAYESLEHEAKDE